MKKRLLLFSILAVCLSLCIGGTLAYYTAYGIERNVITAGNIKIELIETDAEGNPFEDATDVMPGAVIEKEVSVKNSGDNPCWVRLAVEKKIELAEGVEGEPDLSLIGIDFNTTDYTESEADGYYYYNVQLTPGESTEKLFTTVTFDEKAMDNMYKGCKVTVTVTAQAAQVANNGENVTDALGWPEISGEER